MVVRPVVLPVAGARIVMPKLKVAAPPPFGNVMVKLGAGPGVNVPTDIPVPVGVVILKDVMVAEPVPVVPPAAILTVATRLPPLQLTGVLLQVIVITGTVTDAVEMRLAVPLCVTTPVLGLIVKSVVAS
jgi:hypothetical protein